MAESFIFVKPVNPDGLVRKPDMTPLSKDGERVRYSAYWMRRIADRSVVEISMKAEVEKPKAKNTKPAGESAPGISEGA